MVFLGVVGSFLNNLFVFLRHTHRGHHHRRHHHRCHPHRCHHITVIIITVSTESTLEDLAKARYTTIMIFQSNF
jgi:hypothetical protein